MSKEVVIILMDVGKTMTAARLAQAKAAVEALTARGKRVFFATNNSTKSRDHYAAKFASLGMSVSRYQIYTSAYATACYLKSLGFDEITETERREHGERAGDFSKKSVYVIGESGVLRELEEAEIDVEAGVYDSVKCTPTQVLVTFDIDANGILAVSAVDKQTNAKASITISSTSARSPRE